MDEYGKIRTNSFIKGGQRKMDKDLAEYIDSQIKAMYPIFQWRVVKDTQKRLIEIYFTFTVEVSDSVQVQDVLGQTNTQGYIQFEDVVCFYDPAYSHIQPQNYLQAVEIDNDEGIEKGYVDAFLKQLNIVTTEGASDLQDFIEDLGAEEFELHWSERNLEGTIATMKATGRYDEEKMYMNLDEEETLIDQLKKDGQNGGVERV